MSTRDTALALPDLPAAPLTRDIIRAIALDIGKEVAAHIETMYPKAVEATSPNMLRSVTGCVFNEIMGALDTTDEDAIQARLERRKQDRRRRKAHAKKMQNAAGMGARVTWGRTPQRIRAHDRRVAAVHEAGHFVIGRHVGLKTSQASVQMIVTEIMSKRDSR